MPFIITDKCVSEVYAACQQVCPAACIHFVKAMPEGYPNTGQPWMAIDPDECIDCAACKPACPIDAISDDDSSDPYWATINKNLAPVYRGQMASERSSSEPPHRPDNKLVK